MIVDTRRLAACSTNDLLTQLRAIQEELWRREAGLSFPPAAPLDADDFRRLLDESLHEIYIFCPDTFALLFVNGRACAHLGYAEEELRTIHPLALMPHVTAENFQALSEPLRAGTAEEVSWSTEYRRKDGSRYPVDIRLSLRTFRRHPAFVMMALDISERLRTEEALRKSNRVLQMLIASAPLPIICVDGDGRVTGWNPAATALFGWTAEEVLGRELPYVPAGSEAEADMLFAQGLAGHVTGPIHIRRCRKDGRLLDLKLWPTFIRDAQGGLLLAFGLFEDVTEQTRTETALRESEQRYLSLYDNNPSMYFTLCPTGTVLSVNRFGAEQLGYRQDELLGRSVLTVFDPADHPTVLNQLRLCTEQPLQTFTWEIRKVRKDGRRLWVRERARAVADAAGRLTILIVCEDITEHRHTTQFMAALVRESPLPIVSLDGEARVTSWNQAAVRLFGWSEDEVLGRELPYIPPDEEERAAALWDQGVQGSLTGPVELRRCRKDGAILDLLLWLVPIHHENGRPTTIVGLYVDQSDLKQAEAAKLTSELRLQSFLNALDDMALEFDGNGTYVSIWTRNEERLLLPKQELLGKRLADVLAPDEAARYGEMIRRVLATGRSESVDYTLTIRGQLRHFSALLSRIPTIGDTPATVACLVRDTTDQKQTELALRESEARLHRFVADAPVGLVLADWDARILHANRAFCELTGYEEAEIVGQTYALFTHPDDLADNLRLTGQFARGERTDYSLEKRYIRKDGETVWVSVKATTVQLPAHDRPVLLAMVQDITERKNSEELLACEKRILESIANDAALPQVLEALCRMIEAQNAHLLCSIVFLDARRNCLRPGPAPSLPPAFVALVDGIPIGPAVGSCGTAAYTGRPVMVSDIASDPRWIACQDKPLAYGLRACWSMPIKAPSGHVLGTFAVYCRTPRHPTPTELALMERAAHLAGIAMTRAQAQEEREQLSQDLHDNLLQSLYAVGMQLEASKLSSGKSQRKSRLHTAQAIDLLNRLVRDVRQYIASLKHRSIQVSDFGQALRYLAASFSASGETASAIEIEEPAVALITPEQGEQLLNIVREALSNSLRHSGAAHRRVRLRRLADVIRLDICDDGVGFDPKKRRKRGHGLGNMATRARRIRARFSIDARPGKGTCITVDLPLETPA